VGRALKRRSIAIDLLGFGKSDKPNVRYTLPLHCEVVRGFIEALGLKDLALVLQDWGGTIGTRYAVEHPQNIRAVAAMETFLWDMRLEVFPKKFVGMFKMMRGPLGFLLLQCMNMTDKMVGGAVLQTTKIPADVMREYVSAFPTMVSRKAMRDFTSLLLLKGKPESSRRIKEEIEERLPSFKAPICLIRATPGTEYSDEFAGSLQAKLPQLELLAFGPGGHYLQEDDPNRLTKMLVDWFHSQGL
jgi:pimeloyl-ACP methyl ester carboxylesterase